MTHASLALAIAATIAVRQVATQEPIVGPSEAEITGTINAAGHACRAIVAAVPGEILSNRDLLVIVTCDNGAKHVMRITPANRLSYHAPCTAELQLCERPQPTG